MHCTNRFASRFASRSANLFASVQGSQSKIAIGNHRGTRPSKSLLWKLLEFDSRTGFGEFLLDLLSIVLGDLLFDLRRNTFDQLLGIDQGQAG